MSDCVINIGNTGLQSCQDQEGKILVPIIVPRTAEFADMTTPTLLTNWESHLNATASDRWLPLPSVQNYENQDTETTYFEVPYGGKIKIDEGEYGLRFTWYNISMFNTRELAKLNGRNVKVFLATENNYIAGTSSDGIKFEPFDAVVNIEKPTFQGIDAPKSDYVTITLTDPTQRMYRGYSVKASDFTVKDDLVGLIDLKTVTSAATSTTATLTVTEASNSTVITGLVQDDFVMTDSGGTAYPFTGMTDNGDGTYDFTYSTLSAETYTLTIKGQPDATTKGYDIYESDAFTIV